MSCGYAPFVVLTRLFGTVRRPRKNTETRFSGKLKVSSGLVSIGSYEPVQIWPRQRVPRDTVVVVVVVMTLFSKITGEVDKADAAFDALVRPRLHSSALRAPSTEDFIFPPRGSSR